MKSSTPEAVQLESQVYSFGGGGLQVYSIRGNRSRVLAFDVFKCKRANSVDFWKFSVLRVFDALPLKRLPESKQSLRVRFFEVSKGKFCRIVEFLRLAFLRTGGTFVENPLF